MSGKNTGCELGNAGLAGCRSGLSRTGSEQAGKRSTRQVDLFFTKEVPQLFKCAGNALSGGLFGQPQRCADVGKAHVLEEAQEQAVAVGGFQSRQRFIEQRLDLIPVRFAG